MKPLVPLLLAWSLLSAAAPAPVRLEPPHPRLGVPLRLTLEPGENAALAGIPSLGAFALLAPPLEENGRIHLDLLPLRPGSQPLPSFSLHRGRTGHLSSAPLAVEVIEGIAVDQPPAPLKPWPGKTDAEPAGTAALISPLLLLPLFAALLLLRHRRRVAAAAATPPLEHLTGEELLAELQRRLDTLGKRGERWRDFSRRLTEARFAPGAPAGDPGRWLAEYRTLLRGD